MQADANADVESIPDLEEAEANRQMLTAMEDLLMHV
jgi:hypothetical protein